jgi:hypothetical protein
VVVDSEQELTLPGSQDLPPVTPAVAGMMCDDFELSSELPPATLLDLAARRAVRLEEVAPARRSAAPPDRIRRTARAVRAKSHRRGGAEGRALRPNLGYVWNMGAAAPT